jgi:predicted outer membrane repeat protein
MWPLKALRLLSVAGLILVLLGPFPAVAIAPIDFGSRSDTLQQEEPPQPPVDVTPAERPAPSPVHTIHLKSGDVTPGAPDLIALNQLARSDGGRLHVLLQLDFIPRDLAKAEYAKNGVQLLAYVPDYAWIASIPAADPAAVLNLPGVAWAGPLTVNDKLDPAIVNNTWGSWNLAPDGTAAVYIVTHLDEDVTVTRALVEKYGGIITGEVIGAKMLMAEMPQQNISALAAEDVVQWIEPAEPPLGPTNDGIRQQIGVDIVNSAPYSLTGANLDVLVYDSGQAGDHTDFGTRLIHGDADTVSEHSTHVAGTVGGSGANSVAQGGTALQWRGMATAVDLISYGTNYTGSGPIFYQNVPDIESDFAAAQNTYGADLGTASLGSNVYSNYPMSCTLLMGKYGASDVLIDQIIRGGNPVVGVGDKYITTWAVGNERNQTGSCSNTYSSIAPPAAAKNPIHVGASNTNNSTMTSFSSWGPTQDGRIKPIVVAGGCQTTGDGGIKSTDNSPANTYTVMCGTSMATPAVGGSLALMLQHYRAVYSTSGNFWPSTAKAILMQTADDFGNPGPDYQWGFGQVDIQAAVDLISRRAFRQDSVATGGVDVFYMIVPTSTTPLQVSLAWDDYEATFNANPTLINNLDLELEAPSGTIWRPWILNAASPATNATRGVNSVDNQEQTTVPTPEIGTWIVRVKGTTVPQGPQDYSLACEGCKPLDVGVCQSEVSTTALSMPEQLENESGALSAARLVTVPEAITAGEQWQRSLEQPIDDRQPDDQAQLFEKARQQGDAAVIALSETLTGEARDRAMDDIVAAQQRWRDAAPPPLETRPINAAEEQAALEAVRVAESANRAQAYTLFTDPNENAGARVGSIDYTPSGPTADRTVGNGCTYATIAAAITAASPGDRLLIEGGRTFTENLTVNKNLTLQGGYNGCASGSTARTTINGNTNGTAIIVDRALTVTLQNLNVTRGSTGFEGGGIRFAWGDGTGLLTLSNVEVYSNTGQWGGGIWVGLNAEVVGTNVSVHDNTAATYGGGVRLFGGRATFTNTNIYNNGAPFGGGVYATKESGSAPALDLPQSADVYDNQSLTGSGLGGGLYFREGTVSLADCSDLYSNDAINGGGAYLITSTLTMNGSCSEIDSNTATGNGGGVYAQDSTINLDDEADLYNNDAGTDGSGSGGGAYLDDSSLSGDKASIRYNTADDYGGGVYAGNGSVVDLDLDGYACSGVRCSQLSNNTTTSIYGGGIYADGSSVYLDNTFVENNTAVLGGGLYLHGTSAYLNNSLVARNNATSTASDGVRIYTDATLSGSGNTLAYNDAGGAATGQAIGISGGSLTLGCSIVWGHTTSINETGHNVTYSDIQGGYGNSTNLNVNPLFVAPGSQDYHLQNTSPVIDRCVSGSSPDFENEVRPIVRTTAASPYDMGADEVSGIDRVGINGACSYGTIQQAVNAANDGDTIRVAAGVYFENVDITAGKAITIEGGYNNTCTATGAGPTQINGSASSGSTLDISGGTTQLRSLQVAWGSGTGAGLDVGDNGQVTLDNTDVFNNHGDYGGGIWLDTGTAVTITNGSEVHDNTGQSDGGGVRVWGKFFGYSNDSDVYDNCAPNGGGFSVPGGRLALNAADVYGNQAAAATGKGGGIHVTDNGAVTLTNNVFVYFGNTAYDGAGIYADNARINLTTATFRDNTATNNGGGLYLTNNSTLQGTASSIGQEATGLYNEAVRGGGVYAITSTIDFAGSIINNRATSAGGGLYAANSTVNLTGATVGGTGADRPNLLGPSGHEGVGLYLTHNTHAILSNTVVSSNTFQSTTYTYGGGALVDAGSVLTLTNSRIERHSAPDSSDGRGAGLYVRNATVTLDNSQIISNTAGAVGGGVRLYGGTLNVTNGSALINNQAMNGEGGALAATDDLSTPDINISHATLQHNTAATHGGAIYLDSGTLDATGWWDFRWNHAGGHGGAVAVTGTGDADLSADGDRASYLAVNQANGHGGALYVANSDTVQLYAISGQTLNLNTNTTSGDGGAAYANNGAYFDVYGQVQATSNSANGNGGVFYLSGGSRMWLDDYATTRPQIWVNHADNGGAIYASNSPLVDCDGADFGSSSNGNSATAGDGGAIYLSGSTLSADNCIFRNNQATGNGGAIAAYTSTLSIIASYATALAAPQADRLNPNAPQATGCNPQLGPCSAFVSNRADSDANNSGDGGAIYASGSPLTLNYSYLHRNQAARGGAIYQAGTGAVGQINTTLIYSNTSTTNFGAGLRSEGGTVTMTHVTLANNVNGAGYSQSSTTGFAKNSIAWGNTNGGFWITSGPLTGTCNIDQSSNVGSNVNPQFVAAGAGENYRLQGTSPAVDACATGLPLDLDNRARPFNTLFDMGAYEQYSYRLSLPIILKN